MSREEHEQAMYENPEQLQDHLANVAPNAPQLANQVQSDTGAEFQNQNQFDDVIQIASGRSNARKSIAIYAWFNWQQRIAIIKGKHLVSRASIMSISSFLMGALGSNPLADLRAWLNRQSIYSYLSLFLLIYSVVTLAVIARYDWNPSALIRFGHYYMEHNQELSPAGSIRFTGNESYGGNGYDGQIFYYYARGLFGAGEWPEGFSHAYRAPRVGYPLLIAPFALFGSWATVYGMILVQLLCLAGGTAALFYTLHPQHRWLTLLFIIAPFNMVTYSLLVSNSITVSMILIGVYFAFRLEDYGDAGQDSDFEATPWWHFLIAFFAFSVAIMAKESALFVLFPLGLLALIKFNLARITLMLLILMPALGWQLYLREVLGMVPAGILGIFLSPLDGIVQTVAVTGDMMIALLERPSVGGIIALIKHGARWLLILTLISALWMSLRGELRNGWHWRLSLVFVAVSVCIADYFYFWGIFDNIMRMFTLFVPVAILLRNQVTDAKIGLFHFAIFALFVFVLFRFLFFMTVFPFDIFMPYTGPEYAAPSQP